MSLQDLHQAPAVNTHTADAHAVKPDLTVRGARPDPASIWETLLRFSHFTDREQSAMLATVDTLFQRGHELVVATYEHLRHFPETAEVLGWQDGLDETHLQERRRFFTIWLARTLSIDRGSQFGDYLFHAGKVHAAHGQRQIETPSMWITASVGLIVAAFAEFIQAANHPADETAYALSGWNKYLLVQLNQMHAGYEVGKEISRGEQRVEVKAYAMVRHHWGKDHQIVHFQMGETVGDVLRKLLDFEPILRTIMFEPAWEADDNDNDLWIRVQKYYRLRAGWRVQLNGKNLTFHGGFCQPVQPGDLITLFSPGR